MSTENRNPTHGKNPWLARPRAYENETVTVEQAAAQVPDTFTRDVILSQVIDEPGKGTNNPPTREIRTRLHSADAITLGLHLVENGISAEKRNAKDGEGGQRPPYFEHPDGHADRRMPEDFARTNLRLLDAVLARIEDWQAANPQQADYRVTGALAESRKLRTYLQYLCDDTTPDQDAARRQLHADGFFASGYDPAHRPTGDAPYDPDYRPEGEPGALTGHAATDARPVDTRVPRVGATGNYYDTVTHYVTVKVADVTDTAVQLTVTGKEADDYPDGITAPRSEVGTWLVLFSPKDWRSTKDDDPTDD